MPKYAALLPHMLHGCDYNPEQWMYDPAILRQDIEHMKEAHINCVSLGIFAWAALEPKEGEYHLDWLAEVIDNLYKNGIYTVLATPSGARPAWMAKKYPEVLRTGADRVRALMGGRHNHCYTSPVYREKVRAINTQLAARFAKHPGVILWHISNEIQGECHCELCQAAFRAWLREKYGTLEKLNHEWWTMFWSHTYSDWDEIESPSWRGETNVHGLNLDWKRFVSHQTAEFFRNEIEPLKAANPAIPVTTNFMGFHDSCDYYKLLPLLDVVSWDSYPTWHNSTDGNEMYNALWSDAYSDICRSMLGKPFLLMENTPSQTNWHEVCRPKHPGILRLTSITKLAHGADSIQYFQWRQSRGCSEKFHGAVMTHANRTDTRVFREVSSVGAMLEKLDRLCGAKTKAKAAILFDTENGWAIRDAKGPRNQDMGYQELFFRFYEPLWKAGIPVDIVNADMDFSGYHLLCVPMLYLLRGDTAKRIADFTKQGGTVILTMHTGLVNENDLCYMGDTPAEGLAEVAGVRLLEMDPLYDNQHETMRITRTPFPMAESYRCGKLCERISAEGAEVLAVYETDSPVLPDNMPCLTKNEFGRGTAYYVAAFAEHRFFSDLLLSLAERLGIAPVLDTTLPEGVTASARMAEGGEMFWFLMNWTAEQKSVNLPFPLKDFESGRSYQNVIPLAPYGAKILVKAE